MSADDAPSCAEAFVSVVGACREMGLTDVADDAVRQPHARVDQFDREAFAADAHRLTSAADQLGVAVAGRSENSASSVDLSADWSGRSGGSAATVLTTTARQVVALQHRLTVGTAETSAAVRVVDEVLDRHRRILETVSRPRLGGFDLDALPAALNSGAVAPHTVRGEIQARLDYASAAGTTAGDAIAAALRDVARAWAGGHVSSGELVTAGMR